MSRIDTSDERFFIQGMPRNAFKTSKMSKFADVEWTTDSVKAHAAQSNADPAKRRIVKSYTMGNETVYAIFGLEYSNNKREFMNLVLGGKRKSISKDRIISLDKAKLNAPIQFSRASGEIYQPTKVMASARAAEKVEKKKEEFKSYFANMFPGIEYKGIGIVPHKGSQMIFTAKDPKTGSVIYMYFKRVAGRREYKPKMIKANLAQIEHMIEVREEKKKKMMANQEKAKKAGFSFEKMKAKKTEFARQKIGFLNVPAGVNLSVVFTLATHPGANTPKIPLPQDNIKEQKQIYTFSKNKMVPMYLLGKKGPVVIKLKNKVPFPSGENCFGRKWVKFDDKGKGVAAACITHSTQGFDVKALNFPDQVQAIYQIGGKTKITSIAELNKAVDAGDVTTMVGVVQTKENTMTPTPYQFKIHTPKRLKKN